MKFSIRDLLLVTVIVALGTGWVMERRARARQEVEFKKLMSELAAEMAEMSMELIGLRRAAGQSGVVPLDK